MYFNLGCWKLVSSYILGNCVRHQDPQTITVYGDGGKGSLLLYFYLKFCTWDITPNRSVHWSRDFDVFTTFHEYRSLLLWSLDFSSSFLHWRTTTTTTKTNFIHHPDFFLTIISIEVKEIKKCNSFSYVISKFKHPLAYNLTQNMECEVYFDIMEIKCNELST